MKATISHYLDIISKIFKSELVKKRIAVAFTGPSNSGKTTLIVKVAELLINRHNLEVAIIKNDPKDKAHFDVGGKDSYKFSQTGAEVVVTSPTRTTLFSQRKKELDEIVELFKDFDVLLVEGLKTLPLPRIGIFRDKIDESYFERMEAIATDNTINLNEYDVPSSLTKLDLNNPETVIEWIFNNAKGV